MLHRYGVPVYQFQHVPSEQTGLLPIFSLGTGGFEPPTIRDQYVNASKDKDKDKDASNLYAPRHFNALRRALVISAEKSMKRLHEIVADGGADLALHHFHRIGTHARLLGGGDQVVDQFDGPRLLQRGGGTRELDVGERANHDRPVFEDVFQVSMTVVGNWRCSRAAASVTALAGSSRISLTSSRWIAYFFGVGSK